ncbi:hypothetical protein O5541_02965 [Escherichia coli]|nr:hypothetical protein [Escherichia coli]
MAARNSARRRFATRDDSFMAKPAISLAKYKAAAGKQTMRWIIRAQK